MKYWWTVFFLWATVAESATVTVRAGEHDSFTRFVVATDQPLDFDVEQTDREVILQLPGLEAALLGEAFERIGRDRVASISTFGESLRFSKSCACEALIYQIGEYLIVVDIYDSLPSGTETIVRNSRDRSVPTATNRGPFSSLPLFMEGRQYFDGMNFQKTQIDAFEATQGEELSNDRLHLSLLEERLTRQIGKALTQGALRPSMAQNLERSHGFEQSDVESSDEFGTFMSRASNTRTSSVMRVVEASQVQETNSLPGTSCDNSENYDVANWKPDSDFNATISKYRKSLVQEFDRIDRKALLKLAQTYVYFGFGAEAISVVEMVDEDEDPELHAVKELGQLLEYGVTDGKLAVHSSLECQGPLALWAALSFERLPADVVFDVNASIQELNRLPKHLRSLVAPELSERLRERGYTSQALLILRGVERSDGGLTGSAVLEASALSSVSGAPTTTANDLLEVVDAGTVEAPLALIAFINRLVREGEEISPEIALLAESFVVQFRGTEVEADLITAQMLALAKSGQFDKAFSLVSHFEFTNDNEVGDISRLFDILTLNAEDVIFLKYASLLASDNTMRLDEGVLLDMADRSLKAGFPRIARKLLASVVQLVGSENFVRMMADLLFVEGDSAGALDLLASLPNKADSHTAAMANFEAQNYVAAAEMFRVLGDEDLQLEAAFRSRGVALDSLDLPEPVVSLRRLQTDTAIDSEASDIAQINELLGIGLRVREDTDALLTATQF